MKKYTFISVLILLIIVGCKKAPLPIDCGETMDLQLQSNESFTVSGSGGFAGISLGVFKIENGQLFTVSSKGDSLLSNERFLIADNFTKIFPKEMKANPNQNWFSGCNDTYKYSIQIKLANGNIESWKYDPCGSSKIPDYAKCYFDKIIPAFFKL